MKILHVIPNFHLDDEVLHKALSLIACIPGPTENHVVVSEEDAKKINGQNITLHTLPQRRTLPARLSFPTQYIDILYQVMPDIVHIHGSWSYAGANIEKWSRKRGFKVVVSPHGRLKKHVWSLEFLKTRLLPTICYQRNMIHHCMAVHASNEEEKNNLVKLKWNMRINTITTEQSHKMPLFYQNVSDHDIHSQLSLDERQTICYLLHSKLSGKLHQNNRFPHKKIEALTTEQWRRILIYTEREKITDLIRDAVEKLQLNIPIEHVTKMNSFSENPPQYEKLNDKDGLLSMLLDTKKHIKKHTINLRQLSDLYQAFIILDEDEEDLHQKLRQKKVDRFTARMEQILSEIFFLTEGFMPIDKRNDYKTERIRQNIIKKP